jgi:hypothetical protein
MTETLARILLAVVLYGGEMMSGFAPRYSPNVMERVARNRGMDVAGCMVSSPYYDVGEWVLVYGYNTDRALRCRITDVSDPTVKCRNGRCESDKARHTRTKRVTELSYPAALALCGRKHINHRPEQCPVLVVKF